MPSIYYKNGFQERKVLKAIWEDRELRTLQTDGYNVYLYFDDEMLDTDHGCCMSYVRAKFKYAAGTGHDLYKYRCPGYIGKLYALEKKYENRKPGTEHKIT